MGLKDPELGARRRFEVRRGVGGFSSWSGINRDTDPSGMDPWEFHYLQNMTLSGGSIVCRGGQVKANDDGGMSGCVYGIIDLGGDSGLAVYYAGPSHVVSFSPTRATAAQEHLAATITTSTWGTRRVFCRFGDDVMLYGATGGALNKVTASQTSGLSDLALEPVATVLKICTMAASTSGVLYLAENATGTGKIYSWDGTTLATDTTLTANDYVIAAYHETVVVFGLNECKVRQPDGTWSAVSMPGTLTSFRPLDVCVYGDALYCSGRDEAATWTAPILAYNGTTLTVVRTATDGTTSVHHENLEGATAMVVFNSYLYYTWSRSESNGHMICYLGRYDGTTWDDVHHNLENNNSVGAVGCMVEHNGNLYVGPTHTYDDLPHLLDYSAGTTTTAFTTVLDTLGALGEPHGIDMFVL